MGGWLLCPWPGAGAAILAQALLSLPEGLFQVQAGFGPAAALRPPSLGEHEGSLPPGMALGATTAVMSRACLGWGSPSSAGRACPCEVHPHRHSRAERGFPRR